MPRKCCDRPVQMSSKTSGEYKEEVRGPRNEEESQRQLLDAVFNVQPRIFLHRAEAEFPQTPCKLTVPGVGVVNPGHNRSDITENLRTKWQEPEPPHIKQEMEDEEVHHIKDERKMIFVKKEEEEAQPHIKQEEEGITKFPSTGVPFKSKDEYLSEESRRAEPPRTCSSQHMTTEGDGDHDKGSQPDGLIPSPSDRDDMTSDSPRVDDNGQCKVRHICCGW
ncbi:uncharacterized protein LOC133493626 isoform X2 [Syngnathoides biaculeatus]|uniref:uncharacterized protein LOC133493626 isoform X2 n=1 Tax=Syngnathoides biaculeatus TaxID=300417 RepID=UPI002ADE1A6C|nr:uncharacterized protein LOC133493626 isoform X2 [Syngnathoides biaculeatus]